jgi:hypothetical protein
MTSLRERQIREVLDEDLRAYREVLNREVKQAKIMNETYAPPNRFEKRVAFTIDQYFLKLQRHADDIVNRLVNGDMKETGVKDLMYSYQELIAYLDTYASFNAINQRDKAIIENKFDGIANQVEQIYNYSENLDWRSKELLLELSDNLDYRTYLPIANLPFNKGVVSTEMKERGFNDPLQGVEREAYFGFQDEDRDDDEEGFPPDEEQLQERQEVEKLAEIMEKAPRKRFDVPSREQPPRPKNRREADAYVAKLNLKEVRFLAQELGFLDELNAKRGNFRARITAPQKLQMFILREQGIRTMGQREQEATPDPEQLLEEVEMEAGPAEEEEEEELIGVGFGLRGMGEAEDMMMGLPYGYKRSLRLRPMDRAPVHFKTQDERGERGLSLEERMQFLNQLDSKPIKDDMKVNSTGTYKKSMNEKAKRLAKYYN